MIVARSSRKLRSSGDAATTEFNISRWVSVHPLWGAILALILAGVLPLSAAAAGVIARDQAAIRAEAQRIYQHALSGGKPGPTLALVRDLKALYRDVEDPRYKLSFAEQHIAIGVALGNAEMAGAKTYAERALIYHALGFRVVG